MKRHVFRIAVMILFGLALAAPQASAQMVLGGAEGDSHLYFYNAGSAYGEAFWWDDSEARFRLTDGLDLIGEFTASSYIYTLSNFYAEGSALYLNYGGPDANAAVYFYEAGSAGRSLLWDNLENRFEFNDSLRVSNNIVVGSTANVAYNLFGSPASPDSGYITGADDILTTYLEVDGYLMLSRVLFMEGDSTSPVDGDQTIYFANGGTRIGEWIRWDDSRSAFSVSADIDFELTTDTTRYIRNAYDIVFQKDIDADNTAAWFRFYTGGTGGVGTYEQMRITDGDEATTFFDGAVLANGIDYAEAFRIDDQTLEAGDVVVLRFDKPEFIRRSALAGEPHLMGVISDNAGFVTGKSFTAEEAADPEIAKARAVAREAGDFEMEKTLTIELMNKVEQQYRDVALAGRVPVKVDASYGAIQPGDYLTSSATPGHAMALTKPGHAIGIAIEGLSEGTGKVLAFIQPRWYGGPELQAGKPAGDEGTAAVAEGKTSVGETTATATTVVREVGSRVGGGIDAGALRAIGESLSGFQPVIEAVEVGDVLVADRSYEGWLRRSEMAADAAVVGIVTETDGVVLGAALDRFAEIDQQQFEDSFAPVAMSGIVRCKVDASYAAISVGDLLSTSPTPGHAMQAEVATPGTILGKALESMNDGTGTIRVLVMLR